MRLTADPARSYNTVLARGDAPNSAKYKPFRSVRVQATRDVSTPCSLARAAIIRPSGFSESLETQLVDSPSRAAPTATLSSPPPTCTSKLRACSRRCKPGGVRRTIPSPNVRRSIRPHLLLFPPTSLTAPTSLLL